MRKSIKKIVTGVLATTMAMAMMLGVGSVVKVHAAEGAYRIINVETAKTYSKEYAVAANEKGTLEQGDVVKVSSTVTNSNGYKFYKLSNGTYVRTNVCSSTTFNKYEKYKSEILFKTNDEAKVYKTAYANDNNLSSRKKLAENSTIKAVASIYNENNKMFYRTKTGDYISASKVKGYYNLKGNVYVHSKCERREAPFSSTASIESFARGEKIKVNGYTKNDEGNVWYSTTEGGFVSTSRVYDLSKENDLRKAIVDYARKWVGVTPYVYGGTNLIKGADCSGFTQSIYGYFGYSLNRESYTQANNGRSVSMSDLKAGDLLFYMYNGKNISHVAIYIGGGQIAHASTEEVGTIISGMGSPCAARRIID